MFLPKKVLMTLGTLVFFSTNATHAFQEDKTVTITNILVKTGQYGGCVINTNVVWDNADCPTWVSLDCDGTYSSKTSGNQKLGLAQLAYVTGAQINVQVEDTQKFGEYFCYANQVYIE